MKVLVLGGTGTVGSQVVTELLSRKADVSVLTRSADKAKVLPAGARAVTGDVLDPATVRSAFQGMDGVFLLNPVSVTESHEGLMAVNGIRLGGVKRVVYLSVQGADDAAYLPHFGSKVGVEAGLKTSGVEWTILRPNNYYQNDYWFKDAILQFGVYPQPLGDKGCSRVDVRDIAEAAAIALTAGGHAGETYNMVGPDALTGTETAAIWSRVLDRPVAYSGNDLDAWEKQFLQYMPAWMVFDFRQMYAFFQDKGFRGTPEDVARQTKLVGHPPRRFEDFARETAAAWKKS
ncbi:MAG: NmrA family NAD(P)-binding protein [Acidobacteriota bacterium]|nr:NmrA family NAD(P)-binding protein [Acidobacteriota bacterium]MDQ5872059.1 NmrA family NAD(P)-binding protein [Acidobacteriota bacterium]